MDKIIYKPPKCSGCGEELNTVYENVYETYTFNSERGTYSGEAVDAEIRCPHCNCKLWDIFPEGPCNYKAKRKHS